MRKILVTGSKGFVGSNLINFFSKKHELIGLNKEEDITKIRVIDYINKINPDIIVHLAAIKDVNFCENHKQECHNVNVDGTKNIIEAAKQCNSKLIFLSTDYVFKGDFGNYKEDDIKEPTTFYGKTKLEAENLIINSNINYAICRTSGLYIGKNDFVEKIINNLKNKNTFNAFTNIYNSPTYMINLFEVIEEIIENNYTGIFHTAGSERINRFNFAKKIAKHFKLNGCLIKQDIDSLRPKDLSLNIEKTQKIFGSHFNNIEDGLNKIKKVQQNCLYKY